MSNTINMLNTGEVANVAFGLLRDIQENGKSRDILDNLEIPNNRIILSEAQKRAEELRSNNYSKIADPSFSGEKYAKNSYYIICNQNHRLYGKGVVMGLTSKKNGKKVAVPFYINADLLKDPAITRNEWYLNANGYVVSSLSALHNYVSGYAYVHHINGLKTDNYAENLVESNSYLNSQDKLNNSYGISGISVGYNMNKTNGTGTLWRVTCGDENKGYSEYLMAVANKYLWHMQTFQEAYALDSFNQSKFILNAVKYTGLRYDVAMRLAELVIKISHSRNIYDMQILTTQAGLPLTYSVNNMFLIDEKKFLKYCRENKMAYDRTYYVQQLGRVVRKDSTYKKK